MAGARDRHADPGKGTHSPEQALAETLMVLWIIAMFLFRSAWFLYFELGPRGATRASG
jgi:uncharacterized RDD family membrane protein YckC